MGLLATNAIVLHAFDYLETSRILRLLTREAGVQSVLARGARNSRKRFGGALDLFAEGEVQLQTRPGRDLHTLAAFDVRTGRAALGQNLSRFTAATALAECVLRVVHDEQAVGVYNVVSGGLDAIAAATPAQAAPAGLGALWSVVAAVGFAPAIDVCSSCHAELSLDEDATFSHAAGGVLCAMCTRLAPGGRRLPSAARDAIRDWLAGLTVELASEGELRSHQRLLREFLGQHLPDFRPTPAYSFWESGALTG
jgi:DNA repair protein RecO (recombination protein O)